jgi:putative ABC transport system ATP-binding protein
MLEIRSLVKHYQDGDNQVIRAIDGVSLSVAPGTFVALYGPSGSGKSTFLDLIAGFQTPDAGTVLVDGTDVAAMSEREHTRYLHQTIGIVGQSSEPWLPGADARENGAVKLYRTHGYRALALIEPLLEELGLGDRMKQPVSRLSGGERQRVMIATALSTDPRLVLADEPTASLDTTRGQEVLGLLRSRCEERQTAVLLATHDPQAIDFADEVLELRDGHLHGDNPDAGRGVRRNPDGARPA